MRSRLNVLIVFSLLAIVGSALVAFYVRRFSEAMNSGTDVAQTQGVPPATTGDTPFRQAWSVQLSPALIQEMAVTPGVKGEFFALNGDEILRIDANGARRASFRAPSKSTRMATDPTGAMPYLIVVSSRTKWTGAIDYVVTTDYFLHALDALITATHRGLTAWRPIPERMHSTR